MLAWPACTYVKWKMEFSHYCWGVTDVIYLDEAKESRRLVSF